MTFVNELVPEEQKDKFDPEVLYISPATPTSMPYCWAIDRERDMFLIRVGAGRIEGEGKPGEADYHSLHFFRFSLKGQLIRFEAQVSSYENEDGWTIDWFVTNLKIPSELLDRENEIIALLKEAIVVHENSSGTCHKNTCAINIIIK